MRKKLVRHGNSRAIVLDKTLLELLGIGEEDTEVSIETDGRCLTVRKAEAQDARAERFEQAMARCEKRYADVLERLAE